MKKEYKRKVKEKMDKVYDCVNDCSLEEVWEIVKDSMVQVAAKSCGLAWRKCGSRTDDSRMAAEVKKVVSKKKGTWLTLLAWKARRKMNGYDR